MPDPGRPAFVPRKEKTQCYHVCRMRGRDTIKTSHLKLELRFVFVIKFGKMCNGWHPPRYFELMASIASSVLWKDPMQFLFI